MGTYFISSSFDVKKGEWKIRVPTLHQIISNADLEPYLRINDDSELMITKIINTRKNNIYTLHKELIKEKGLEWLKSRKSKFVTKEEIDSLIINYENKDYIQKLVKELNKSFKEYYSDKNSKTKGFGRTTQLANIGNTGYKDNFKVEGIDFSCYWSLRDNLDSDLFVYEKLGVDKGAMEAMYALKLIVEIKKTEIGTMYQILPYHYEGCFVTFCEKMGLLIT